MRWFSRDTMKGTDAQCTVPGGSIAPGLVMQGLKCGEEDYRAVAIEGASPLMPLPRLILWGLTFGQLKMAVCVYQYNLWKER